MKKRIFRIMMVCYLVFSLSFIMSDLVRPVSVSAAAKWTDDADKSIYKGGKKDEKNVDLGDPDEEKLKENKSGGLAGLLAKFFNTLSDWIDDFFGLVGLSLKNIIYGRVGGGGVIIHIGGKSYRTALFTYESVSGNIYGIVSFAIYSILRVMAAVMAAVFIGGRFVGALWSTNTENAKKIGIETMKNAFFFFILLVGMPMIIDLLLYVRDMFLYSVNSVGVSLLGMSADSDVGSAFNTIAENSPKNIMISLVRLASKFLTLYFAFSYIGVALSLVVDVIAFPFVGISMLLNPRMLGQWLKNVISQLLVPMIDCILLLIVLLFSVIGGGVAVGFIQLMVLFMLIPARAEFRKVLGLNPSFGMEMAALGGFGATLGLAGAAVKGAASVMGGGKAAWDMKKMGDMYEDAAGAEKGNGSGGRGGSNTPGGLAGDPDAPLGGGGGAVDSYGSASSDAANETISEAASSLDDSEDESPAFESFEENENDDSAGIRSAAGNTIPNSVLRKYANTNNFENGAFNALTNEQKAKLYHMKAMQKAAGVIAGAAGGIAGTGVGLAASVGASGGMGGAASGIIKRAGDMGGSLAAGAVNGVNLGGRAYNLGRGARDMFMDRMFGSPNYYPYGGENDESAENMPLDTQSPYGDMIGQTSPSDYLLEQTSAVFGEEDLAAAKEFMGANPEFYPALDAMEDFSSVDGFDSTFDQCAKDYPGLIGSPKPENLSSGENSVWQNTPEDRYQYFRTQIPNVMTSAFSKKLNDMAPLADGNKNQMAKDLISDTYGRMVSSDNYAGMSRGALAMQGYNFENGYQRISPESQQVRQLAKDNFIRLNPGMSSVMGNLADISSNAEINDAFRSCEQEWPSVVGSPKPETLSNGEGSVWRDTPEDRYQYFRTQKAEPLMAGSFEGALKSMIPLPNAKANDTARNAVMEDYKNAIAKDSFTALQKDNLQLMGYDFSNGFRIAGEDTVMRKDGSIMI